MNVNVSVIQGSANGVTVKVTWDPHPDNPREWRLCRAVLACWDPPHAGIGDKHDFVSPQDFGSFAAKLGPKRIVFRPLYLLDHSGLWLSTTPFEAAPDSYQIGWAYVTREKGERKDWLEAATEALEAEVSEYASYLCGYVFTVEVTGPRSEEPDCYTVYGKPGQFLSEAIKNELYESAYPAIEAIEWGEG